MPRLTHTARLGLAALAGLAALVATRTAVASYPCSTYVVPSSVELEPSDDAATGVVIHGAFFQLTSDTAMTYANPRCGVMHFACVAGQEEMCRMQWKELRDAVSPTPQVCEGFGSWNVIPMATIRDEGGPLAAPDAWDLGMGVSQGGYLDNKCPPAMHLACPLPAADGGAVTDAAPPTDAAPSDDAAPAVDAPPPVDAPSSAMDAAPAPVDAPEDRVAGPGGHADASAALGARNGGCTVAATTSRSFGAAALALAVLVLAGRRRRGVGR